MRVDINPQEQVGGIIYRRKKKEETPTVDMYRVSISFHQKPILKVLIFDWLASARDW